VSDAALIPVTDDPDTGRFWESARRGQLSIQRCIACSAWIHLPKVFCGECGSDESQWIEVAPTGSIYTWTTVERSVREAFPAPYTLVVVDFDDAPGVRLVGRIDGRPNLHAGRSVVASFERVGEAVLPTWRLSDDQSSDGV
jgi:uncharacterized protein